MSPLLTMARFAMSRLSVASMVVFPMNFLVLIDIFEMRPFLTPSETQRPKNMRIGSGGRLLASCNMWYGLAKEVF
jgi:hypothetical protein